MMTAAAISKATDWSVSNWVPSDTKAPHFALEFLFCHQETLPETEKVSIIERLAQTDLSYAEMSSTDWKTYAVLQKTYPQVFLQKEKTPFVKIIMNGQEMEVSKNFLFQHEYFRKIWAGKEESEQVFEFVDSDCSEDVTREFLNYLAYGSTNLSVENAPVLIHLASKYQMKELEEIVGETLEKHLSLNTLEKTLQLGLQYKSESILRSCLLFILRTPERVELVKLIDKISEEGSLTAEAQFLQRAWDLRRMYACQGVDMTKAIRISEGRIRMPFIDLPKEFPIEIHYSDLTPMQLLNHFCECLPIELVVTKYHISNSELAAAMKELPHLKHLDMSHCSNVSPIPGIEQLLTLTCSWCPKLRSIVASNAEKVVCNGSNSLEELIVSQAKVVFCHNCRSLETFFGPQVIFFNGGECDAVKALSLPEAIVVECSFSEELSSLKADKALEIRAEQCCLMELEASSVKKLFCSYNPLKTLDVLEAETVECRGCVSMQKVRAPQASLIDRSHCHQLKQMEVSSTCEIIGKAPWEIDKNGIPLDKRAPALAIHNLLIDDTIKPEERKEIISLLQETDLSQANMDEYDWAVFGELLKKYPKLRSSAQTVKVAMGDHEIAAPKNVLFVMPFFRASLTVGREEPKEGKVTLGDTGYPDDIIRTFLTYLETGEVTFSGGNVMALLALAKMYIVKDLETKIAEFVRFIKKALTIKNVSIILENSLELGSPMIVRECLGFLWKIMSSAKLGSFMQKVEAESETLAVLKDLKALKDLGVEVKFDDKQQLIKISGHFPQTALASLDRLCQIAPIQLDLSKQEELNDESLEALLEQLPHLQHLVVHHSGITRISAKQLRTLDCDCCENLEVLILSKAKKVSCSECPLLREITANEVEELISRKCGNLKTITALRVRKLDCDDCPLLEEIIAPLALRVTCWSCLSLKKFFAPLALYVDCSSCENLKELILLHARVVKCDRCSRLIFLKALEARNVSCTYCILLNQFEIANVEIFDCSFCSAIKILNLSRVRTLTSEECIGLIELKAAAARIVHVNGCIKLIKVYSPEANLFESSGCVSLQKLILSEGATIECPDCVSLKILRAPKATRVNAHLTNATKEFEVLEIPSFCLLIL